MSNPYEQTQADSGVSQALARSPYNSKPTLLPSDLRWLRVEEFFNAKTIAPNTKKAYSFELERFVDWTDKAWNNITGRDVANYKRYLETCATDSGKRQRSPATVAVAMTALKSFFKWMVASYYITENPCAAVTIPPQKKPQPQHLEDSEVEALYEALEYRGEMQLRARAILAVLEHGLRAEEVSQLNISDYDGERVSIRQAKHDSTGWVTLALESSLAVDSYLEARRQQNSTTEPDRRGAISLSFSQAKAEGTTPRIRWHLQNDTGVGTHCLWNVDSGLVWATRAT